MTDVAQFLSRLGLDRYAEMFTAAEIDLETLPQLTGDDLKDLGLPIGPRRKILTAIASLSVEPAPRPTGPEEPTPTAAERRQLTVVFVDLVGSTALAQGMDPEELRGVIRGFQDAAAGAITRYEGHVAKYMGDGVLAYFGWPRAHEDDAERAVRAGLGLLDALRISDRALAVRIGIATGVVVVGDVIGEGGAREEAAVGDTLNLAARLQQLAAPGTIAIAPSTRDLLGQAFDLESLGPQEFKGMAASIEAWRVAGERTVETRFEAARGQRLMPLVGRDQEIALALARWEQAKSSEGQVLLLRAEPGIGKSRLVAELRLRLETLTLVSLRYQASPHHTNSAFYPIIQELVRRARCDPSDSKAAKIAKLATMVERSRTDSKRAVPLLASLLSIPLTGEFAPAQMAPQELKTETLSLLVEMIAGLADSGPILMIVEDLHWIDPTTREFLDQVVARIETLPVLMLVTFRPEIASPWEGRGHVTLVTLARLGRRQVEAHIAGIAGDRQLPPEIVDQIAAKSDGVPLFVEELTKAVLDSTPRSGDAREHARGEAVPALAVPSSLHASLLARLDRIPSAREIAQIAAALGREFDFDLLAAVAPQGDSFVAAALHELHRAELVFPRGAPPRTRWSFKHALIQDAAYETLLKASRSALHARIAQTIVTRFPLLAEAEPETIARHYENGGDPARAAAFWHEAGARALARHAGVEAVEHLARAIDLYLAATPDEIRLEVEVQLGEALAAAGRLSEAVPALEKAVRKSRAAGNPIAFARSAIALCQSEVNSSRAQEATVALLEEALATAASFDDRLRLRLMNMRSLGLTMIGQFERARAGVDAAIALARRLGDPIGLAQALEIRFLVPIGLTPEQIAEYRQSGQDLVAATTAAGHPLSEARVLTQQIFWSAQFGDIASLRRLRAALDAMARRIRIEYQWAVTNQVLALEAILAGDLATAERCAGAALEVGQRENVASAPGIYGIQMFTIRREQGRLAEVAGLFKKFVDEAPEGAAWEPGFALLASDLGYEAPARRILSRFAGRRFALPFDAMRSATLSYFAEVAIRLKDREAAGQIYRLLLPYQHMTITVGMSVVCYGAAGRFLGRLADLLDDQQVAAAHFERALEMDARMEAWLWLAHTQAEHAAALRRWGRASDLVRAGELASAAMATAQRLGLTLLQRKLAAALQ